MNNDWFILRETQTNPDFMNGCRSLSQNEINLIADSFHGKYALRNKALFLTGVYTGYRVSELLSLRHSDVFNGSGVRTHISVNRSKMKGKRSGRTLPLHPIAREALRQWIGSTEWHSDKHVFHSQKGGAINRQQAHNILKTVFNDCDLDGKLATHTMRKTFANKVWERSGKNLFAVKELLGHSSIAVTQNYLGIADQELNDIILGI